MRLKEEFARAQQEREERVRAAKSVASTPKVAGVGAAPTPTPRRGAAGVGKTPRRFGF